MMQDKNSLQYLISLREESRNRYERKPQKLIKSGEVKPVTGYDYHYPLNGFPWICGSYKSQVENF